MATEGAFGGAELAARRQFTYNTTVMWLVRIHRDFSDFQRRPDATPTCPQDAKTRLGNWRFSEIAGRGYGKRAKFRNGQLDSMTRSSLSGIRWST
jgi:hypothetical protein